MRLQSQYRKYYKSDIHHCFDTIPAERLYEAAYLTDIPTEENNNFANRFFGIMKEMRTKDEGIIIGPEFSRLYAEMILQRIDSEIMAGMEKAGQVLHQDYECFRYLDDTFLFYDSDKTLELFKKIYSYRLMSWGMTQNEEKEELATTPFIASLTIAKNEIDALIKKIFKNGLEDSASHGKVSNMNPPVPYSINASGFYKEVLTIITNNGIELSKVSSFLLSRFQKEALKAIDEFDNLLEKYIEAKEEGMLDEDGLHNLKRYLSSMFFFLRQLIKAVFLIFKSDIRMNTSIRVVMIVDSIIQYSNSRLFKDKQVSLSIEIKESIYKYVRDELTSMLKSYKLRQMNGLEICNLMTILADISDGHGLTNKVLENFVNGQFDIEKEVPQHGVNFLMAFALLKSLKSSNVEIRNKIIAWLEHRLDIKKWDINDAECFYIIFGLTNLFGKVGDDRFNTLAKTHNIETKELSRQTTAFMQWSGESLQKACSEKASADVY